MNLWILAFFILTMMAGAYLLNDFDALCPSVLFCAGFFVCAAFAVSSSATWQYGASDQVVETISLGLLLFVASAVASRIIMRGEPTKETKTENSWILPVNGSILIIFAILQILVLVWTLREISAMFPASDPLTSISLYDHANKFTDEGVDSFTFPLGPLRGLCTVVGYYICYLIGQSYATRNYRNLILLVINLIIAMLVSLESGGRNTAISYIVYCFIDYLIMRRQWLGTKRAVPFKIFVIGIIGFIIIIGTFQAALGLMGRSSGTDYWQYICMYVGAEIPNLDSFLSNVGLPSSLFGKMTFYTSINWIGSHLNITSFVYQMDLPFQYRNGVSLGNVYTTFYAFVYDFGFIGLITLTALMAIISQWVYERAIRFDRGTNSCIWVMIYSLAANTLLMSFFSNKFYESFFCIGLIRQLIFLLMVHYFYVLVTKKSYLREHFHSKTAEEMS